MTIHRRDSNAAQAETWELYHQVGTVGGGSERFVRTNNVRGGALSTVSPPINTLRAWPYLEVRGGRVDRIEFEVTTVAAAGGVGRVGIYRNLGRGKPYPTSLIVDGGEFVTTSLGRKQTVVSIDLSPGLYWFAGNFGVAAPSIRAVTGADVFPLMGWPDASLAMHVGRNVSSTYGALPATFPNLASGLDSSQSAYGVGVRYSS